MGNARFKLPYFAALLLLISPLAVAAGGGYKINPGDVLKIFVWNEAALSGEVIVRPDGIVSVPMAGHIQAGGEAPEDVEKVLAKNLSKYLKDEPVVTVSLLRMDGNIVYVLGKVNRPGAYPVVTQVDVAQALALAGGLNSFADEDSIKVLRRDARGGQKSLSFDYSDVKKGKRLDSNIVLQSGDLVIVP